MDNRKYEKFYGYGAYACAEKPKEFHQYRYRLFQDFLDANPTVIPYDDGIICCETHLLVGGRWRCHQSPYCCRDFEHDIYDHKHSMRIKGVRKSIFIATHPYQYMKPTPFHDECDYSDMPSKILKGLIAKIYPKGKSWYYPEVSNLCIISTGKVLERLDLRVLGEPIEVVIGALER